MDGCNGTPTDRKGKEADGSLLDRVLVGNRTARYTVARHEPTKEHYPQMHAAHQVDVQRERDASSLRLLDVWSSLAERHTR